MPVALRIASDPKKILHAALHLFALASGPAHGTKDEHPPFSAAARRGAVEGQAALPRSGITSAPALSRSR